MDVLRAVQRDTYQESIHPEELAPILIDEGRIGLDGVQDPLPAGKLLLVPHCPPVEIQAEQQGLTTVPTE